MPLRRNGASDSALAGGADASRYGRDRRAHERRAAGTVRARVSVDIDGAPALVYADLDAPGYGRRRQRAWVHVPDADGRSPVGAGGARSLPLSGHPAGLARGLDRYTHRRTHPLHRSRRALRASSTSITRFGTSGATGASSTASPSSPRGCTASATRVERDLSPARGGRGGAWSPPPCASSIVASCESATRPTPAPTTPSARPRCRRSTSMSARATA